MPAHRGEIGSAALHVSGGIIREDILVQLQGYRGRMVFTQMADNDPVIGAVLLAIRHEAHRVEWKFGPAEDDDESNVEFAQSCLDDMTIHWDDSLSAILSMLPYGFSLHEIVYKRRDGLESDHTDNMVGWHKFARRPQPSIERWEVDPHGEVSGAFQRQPAGSLPTPEVFIPIEKCLHFRTTLESSSPEGKSILRNAYRPWFYKNRIEEIEGIGIERDLAGIPVATVPRAWMSDEANAGQKAAYEMMQEIVRNIHQDEAASLVIPAAYDESGNQMVTLELLTSGGTRQFDTTSIIARWDNRIAGSMLADFMMLGQGPTGTYSLATVKIDLFAEAVNAWLDRICRTVTEQGVRRLMALNGLAGLPPQLTHTTVRQANLEVLGKYIAQIGGAGLLSGPDPELEEHLRKEGGLPALPDDLTGDYQQLAMEAARAGLEMAGQTKPPPEGGGPEAVEEKV